jgi:hypothetical protein
MSKIEKFASSFAGGFTYDCAAVARVSHSTKTHHRHLVAQSIKTPQVFLNLRRFWCLNRTRIKPF